SLIGSVDIDRFSLDRGARPDVTRRTADKDLKLACFHQPAPPSRIVKSERALIQVKMDGLGFARLEKNLGKPLEFLGWSRYASLSIAYIELDHFVAGSVSAVPHGEAHPHGLT